MKLAVVAGEASGDLHAAEVIRELKKLDPSLRTFGIGGDLLAREGTEILHHAREMGIVGLFNVIRHLGMFRRVFRELAERIEQERPDVVLLVDYPDFNLRMAKRCKEMGLRVVYYISPQIWAWRRGRVKHIAKYVDHMIVIFPFEEDFYRQHNVAVTYVGHPLIDELTPRRHESQPGVLRVALLPGSRRMEVEALLPPMLKAVAILKREQAVDAFIIQAPTIDFSQWSAAALGGVRIVPHDQGEALSTADIALSSSGTATLECAIVGTPVVVMYRLSPMTYQLAKWLVKLPHFSLVNIVAGKRIVPELLQHDVTGEKIAAAVREVLVDDDRVRADLAAVKAKLGEKGASRRAAEAIMGVVRG
ncbi:MAG TPA: lipid-A-disaccharide synthase [Thermoanaerobaculia bacterium]|jgi:lipid-A-disaccharide synthase|nr:lipid-A-disaccharide synthase [Thermoanaerobaculia bacterium]